VRFSPILCGRRYPWRLERNEIPSVGQPRRRNGSDAKSRSGGQSEIRAFDDARGMKAVAFIQNAPTDGDALGSIVSISSPWHTPCASDPCRTVSAPSLEIARELRSRLF
jgi:hypothetical protein